MKKKIHILVGRKSIETRCPPSVMAPANGHLVITPGGHKGLRASISGRSSHNNYWQVCGHSMCLSAILQVIHSRCLRKAPIANVRTTAYNITRFTTNIRWDSYMRETILKLPSINSGMKSKAANGHWRIKGRPIIHVMGLTRNSCANISLLWLLSTI